MQIIDEAIKTRGFQAMVEMRDGTRLNTFVFLPGSGGPRWPVILHRTPYGITTANTRDKTDVTKAWLPSPEEPLRGSILRGWRKIVAPRESVIIRFMILFREKPFCRRVRNLPIRRR